MYYVKQCDNPDCARQFTTRRTNQRYCGAACSELVHMRMSNAKAKQKKLTNQAKQSENTGNAV